MSTIDPEARRRSAGLFGNEKVVEVVLALEATLPSTAQALASRTGIAHNLVGAVLKKLASASILTPLPRTSSRGPAYYDVSDPHVWADVLRLCQTLSQADPTARAHSTRPASDLSQSSSVPEP